MTPKRRNSQKWGFGDLNGKGDAKEKTHGEYDVEGFRVFISVGRQNLLLLVSLYFHSVSLD
jgi:hypothetical protein